MHLARLFKPDPRFTGPNYRGDIDGLRTIAILSVILYHLNIPYITGGYIGVDVFFVISGYLMTSIVTRRTAAGNFSFANFYEHRVRRIVPSLFVTLVAAALGAILTLSVGDLVRFSNSMGAALLFVGNIYFYLHSGYFEADIASKPLVHLWSLGVEGQFYLLWPIVLLFLQRKLPLKAAGVALGILALASLGISITLGASNGAFYLLPARVFEFMLGAAVVWLPKIPRTENGKSVAESCILFGLAMIGLSIAMYTVRTPFPSYYALLPTLGAAMVIYGGSGPSELRILLSNRVMTYLGRISYELYLFHWIVIVYYRGIAPDATSMVHNAIIVAITAVLSVLTYHFVSCPLRYGHATDTKQKERFFIGTTTAFALLCVLVVSISASKGWMWRLDPKARIFVEDPEKFHQTQYGGINHHENTLHTLGDKSVPPQFLVLGDSFAGQYASALDEWLKEHKRSAYLFYVNGCLFTPNATIHMQGKQTVECKEALSKMRRLLAGNNMPVIHAQSWSSYKEGIDSNDAPVPTFPKDSNSAYYQFILGGVEQMRVALAGRPYMFVGIAPGIQENKSIAQCFAAPTWIPNRCAKSAAAKEEERQNGQEFNTMAQGYVTLHPDVIFINPRTAMCHDGLCYASTESQIFYSDFSHFTKDGALEVLNKYEQLLLSLHP